MKRIQGLALAKVSALALICATGAPQAALAQDAAPTSADEATAGDIVVTARLREENVQTVPIAIVALSAEELAKRNISNLNDLTNSTPGVAITTIAGGTLSNIYIRGQAPANTTNDLNVEANVGVFIDDIYQTSRNTIDIISVLDVGQIEIAKGPQSALFGRSTFAGAMSISTRRPAKDFEGNIQATVGVDKDYRIRGSVSVPISDTLALRVGGGYLTYDGFGDNSAEPGDKLGGTMKYAGTASLEYRPTEELTARLSGFVAHSETELSAYSGLPLSAFNCGTTNAATGLRTQYCGTLTAREVSSITPGAPDTVADSRQVSLNLNWRRNGVAFTSVTGFTEAENRTYNDYDMTGAGVLFGVCTLGASCSPAGTYTRLINVNGLTSNRERVRTFSQEIRLQSDNSSPFQWIFGGSYFNSRVPLAALGIAVNRTGLAANERLVQVSQTTTPVVPGVGAYDFTANPFLTDGLNTALYSSYTAASTKTMSVFGSLGYSFGNLRIGAEGRFNIDRKRAQVFAVSNPLSAPGINQPIPGTSTPTSAAFVPGAQFARTFESFAPRFTVDYRATPDIFFYATAAKGVRSGGFNTANPVSATGILADEVAYEEETNWTYEAGVKSELFDKMLLLNASYFHVDWTNAQVSAFTLNPTAVNPTRIVRNAGNIKTNGFEVQTELRIADMFKIGGSLVYSDPKFQAGAYDASIVAQCVVGTGATATAAPGCPPVIVVNTAGGGARAVTSLEGLRPQRAVKLSWNLNASMDVPLTGDWRLFSRVDVNHSGDTPMNLTNTALFGERTLTSARIAVENDQFSIAVWANNIFDVNYVANAIAQPRMGIPFVFSVPEIYLGEGRRFGLTVGAKF